MAVSLPDFPPFDVEREPTSLSQRWKKWVGRFENLIIALDIKQSKRKKALLLHYAGPAVQEIADTLPPAARDDDRPDEYDATLAQLNGYFNPKKNVEYEVFTFRQARQREEEMLDQICSEGDLVVNVLRNHSKLKSVYSILTELTLNIHQWMIIRTDEVEDSL